jgi:cobalt-zinc-cadmium efflux system membrane fusion protein
MNETPTSNAVLEIPQPPRVLPAPPATVKPPKQSRLKGILASVPNLLVLALLAGLGWWGHHSGWKLPKFSQLTGNSGEEKDDWCETHSVPDSQCIECKPDLMPRDKSVKWCKVHGVHECPFEHPEIVQTMSPASVTPEMLPASKRALDFKPRTPNSEKCQLYLRRIQFASDDAVKKAGIEVTNVSQEPIVETLTANGEITYDQTLVAKLSPPIPGRVWQVYKRLGEAVRKGEVMALVDAADVGKTKAEFVSAASLVALRAQRVDSLKALAGTAVPEANYLEAQNALREAEARLITSEQALINFGLPVRAEDFKGVTAQEMNRRIQFLGLPAEVARTLDARTTTANLVPVKAPFDGVIVERKVVPGEQVDASKTLFVLADTRQMWLTLNVRVEDARFIRARDEATKTPGQEVRFSSEALPDEIKGEVVWISTSVDEKTRTVQVRVNLPNSGALRANTFGTGKILLREEKEAIIVPSESVQWEGDCNVVFVRDRNYHQKDAKKVFHTRTVRVGAKDAGNTEIIAGVLPGEVVVTKGAGILRSELLKNNLGAG